MSKVVLKKIYLATVVDFAYDNTEQPEIFMKEVSEILLDSVEIKEEFMGTVADYLHNKGRDEGRDEGLELGRKTTCQNILQRLFRLNLIVIPQLIKNKSIKLVSNCSKNGLKMFFMLKPLSKSLKYISKF